MELFPFIDIIFTNPREYLNLSVGEKRKHFFMCNRRFAIQHPLQANALQHNKINQEAVIDFWHLYLRKTYKGYLPKWIYTKGVKKVAEVKEKKLNISNDLIKEYCKAFELDPKTVRDALTFYPDEMIKELKEFEKVINQK